MNRIIFFIITLLFSSNFVYATVIGANYNWFNNYQIGTVNAGAEPNLLGSHTGTDYDIDISANQITFTLTSSNVQVFGATQTFVFSGGTFDKLTSVSFNGSSASPGSNPGPNPSVSVTTTTDTNDTITIGTSTAQWSSGQVIIIDFTATSTVSNAAPTDISLSNNTLDDSATGTNTTVGSLSTTDSDSGDSHTYTLVTDGSSANGDCGASSSDDNNSNFNINGNTLRTNSTLLGGTYNICIQSDDATTSFQKGFTITINDTTAPTVSLSVSDGSVNENGGTSTITATLNKTSSQDTTVAIGIKSGSTATLNSDFTLSSTTITIPANNLTGTVTLTSSDDSIDDDSETAIVEIVSVSGGDSATENGTQEQTITIIDDDDPNTTPTINDFSNITIFEDSGLRNYDLNISDVEGDELNVTIDSNNTSLLTVSSSLSTLVQGDYDGVVLNFSTNTVLNANGVARITINVTDSASNTISKSFNVNVTAINDAPTISTISKKVYVKNFQDQNISINAQDVEGDLLTYNVTIANPNLADVNNTNEIITIKSIQEQSGTTNINITVSDGNLTSSSSFELQILSSTDISDDNSVDNSNGSIKTTTKVLDNDVSIQTQKKPDGKVTHKISFGSSTFEATSNISGSKVSITDSGVQTTYKDNSKDIDILVSATVTGEATHNLVTAGKTTRAISNVLGTKTTISQVDQKIQINTTATLGSTNIGVLANQDGTAQHSVETSGLISKAISSIIGATTKITDSGVTTSVDTGKQASQIGRRFEAVAISDENGNTITKFREVDTNDGTTEYNIQSTLNTKERFPLGSTVTISEDSSGKVHIQTLVPKLSVETRFIIE